MNIPFNHCHNTFNNLFICSLCSILVSCTSIKESLPTETKKPNILFCIADDASYLHMGAYGCSWVNTPNFDRVAKEGILFNNAYTPNAKCSPSRACIMTGRNPWQLEEAANHIPHFPQKFRSFMEVMPENGYHTGYTGKGWSPGNPGEVDGVRRTLTSKAYNELTLTPPTDRISGKDYSANFEVFLNEKPKDKPFCFWYGAHEPHRSYTYHSGIDLGKKNTSDIDRVPGYWPDVDSIRVDMLDYGLEVEYFDKHLGQILDKIEKAGELENTLVIVTSDNGMPFPRSKGMTYEISHHMPFAVMWADKIVNPGRKVDDFISFIDVAPTILSAAGIDPKTGGMFEMQGRSFEDILSDNPKHSRGKLLVGRERNDVGRPDDQGYPVRGIRHKDFLYFVNFEPDRWPACNPETGYMDTDGSPTKTVILNQGRSGKTKEYWNLSFGKRAPVELYDVKKDPDCIQNLAGEENFASIENELKEMLFAELKIQGDPRMFGNGQVFDQYEFANSGKDLYNRYMNGERMNTGWINPSDFETSPVE